MTLEEYNNLLGCNWLGYQRFNKHVANQNAYKVVKLSYLIIHTTVFILLKLDLYSAN